VTTVPVLLYHSVSSDASEWARPFAVTPEVFRQHIDSIVERDMSGLTASSFAKSLHERLPLPERPVVVTFDDGFADFADVALPALRERRLATTLFVTTGFLEGHPDYAPSRWFDDRMLAWSQLRELHADGVEIGAHTHTHPQLDTLSRRAVWDELTRCKSLLEDELGTGVASMAYPHGYSSPAVRRLVRAAGYESAYSVKEALSSTSDDPYSIARLTVRRTTSLDELCAWLAGTGARVGTSGEALRTRLWRIYRRARAVVADGSEPRRR
jgi:peptidoglycan/xylan/chitin deacetylase (PgdA/CDA1 family)